MSSILEENTSPTLKGVRLGYMEPSVTLADMETYIKRLACRQFGEDKYLVNMTIGFVASATTHKRYKIFIPEVILTDIKLEEL